jgi:hypothetical protein
MRSLVFQWEVYIDLTPWPNGLALVLLVSLYDILD